MFTQQEVLAPTSIITHTDHSNPRPSMHIYGRTSVQSCPYPPSSPYTILHRFSIQNFSQKCTFFFFSFLLFFVFNFVKFKPMLSHVQQTHYCLNPSSFIFCSFSYIFLLVVDKQASNFLTVLSPSFTYHVKCIFHSLLSIGAIVFILFPSYLNFRNCKLRWEYF